MSKPALSPTANTNKLAPDARVHTFLNDLTVGNFNAAESAFNDKVKGRLSQEQLATLWLEQTARLGDFQRWKILQQARQDGMEIRVAQLDFQRGALKCLVAIDPATNEIGGFFLKPVAQVAPPASYVISSAFDSEEVKIGKEPFVLGATLTIPKGKGPFPATVLVHGSGPHDRDESIGGNKPFKDIAEGLSSRGIVVLRYDKRTFAHRLKISNSISIDDEVIADAMEAIRFLRDRPDVDGSRIFVAGHSLGALLAPEIANRAPPIAGIVLLAPPGRVPWDAVLAQMRFLHLSPEKLAEIERQVASLRQSNDSEGSLLGVPFSYWRDWASHNGAATAKKLNKPALLLRGERDYQVVEEDIQVWRAGLKGMKTARFVTVPGANHLFIHGEGEPSPAEYETPSHVDPLVMDELVKFISASPAQRRL